MRYITSMMAAALLFNGAQSLAEENAQPVVLDPLPAVVQTELVQQPRVPAKTEPTGRETVEGVVINETGLQVDDEPNPMMKWIDWTCDGCVDIYDLLGYIQAWCGCSMKADLDEDGSVHAFDLLVYLDEWMHCGVRKR